MDSLNYFQIKEFLKPQYDLNKYIKKLFTFFYLSNPFRDSGFIKSIRKYVLKLAQVSKRPKDLDNSVIVVKAQIITLWDQWMMKQNESTSALKIRLKKAEVAEKKKQTKLDKNSKKA